MKTNKHVFHPSNPFIYMMLFLSSILIGLGIYSLVLGVSNLLNNDYSESSLFMVTFVFVALGGVLFYFFFNVRLIMNEDTLVIVSYLDKTHPQLNQTTHHFSQFKNDMIAYNNLRFFGSYFAYDVRQYLYRGLGRLAVDIQPYEHNSERFYVQLHAMISGLRSVLVFVDDQNGLTVMDAELYGHRETQRILFEISNRTGLESSGLVEAKYRWSNFWLDAALAMLVLAWVAIMPFFVIELVWSLNPAAKLDSWGTIMILSLFLGNISALGIIEGLKSSKKQRSVKDFKLGMWIFSGLTLFCYLLTLIFFVISIQS